MKKAKIWMLAAVLMILVGCLVLCCVAAETEGDFMKLSTEKFETNRYEIYENYWDITVITNTAEVEFAVSEDGTTSVTCFEESKLKHTVRVKDGKLVISVVDTRKWYDHIMIGSFKTPRITVSLPAGEYGALLVESLTGKVHTSDKLLFDTVRIQLTTGAIRCLSSCHGEMSLKTSTGDITVKGVSVGALALSVTTGDVNVTDTVASGDVSLTVSTGGAKLSNVTCTGLVSSGSTGSLRMANVIASEEMNVRRTTGSVYLEGCDAAELYLNTDTGDVRGTLLSEKTFDASSDTGKVRVPKNTDGGKCRIRTDTGNIEIKIAE